MSIQTLIRAWFMAKWEAEEAAYEQDFRRRVKKKETRRELDARLRFSVRRYQQAAKFKAAVLRRAGLEDGLG